MSHYYGGGFNEWIEDSFFSDVPAERMSQIKTVLEPYRETVESCLASFSNEEASWRDYRNSLWYYVSQEDNELVGAIADGEFELLRPARYTPPSSKIIVGTPNPFGGDYWRQAVEDSARQDFADAMMYAIGSRFTEVGIVDASIFAVRNVLPAHVRPPDEILRIWFGLEDGKQDAMLDMFRMLDAWTKLDVAARDVVMDYAKQVGGTP